MPDITMCLSENCPVKNICFRYTAKPDALQSYSNFIQDCAEYYFRNFWSNKQREYRRKINVIDEISD